MIDRHSLKLLDLLADTRCHAIDELAATVELAPTAVAERLHVLRDQGVAMEIEANYCRLPQPVARLDAGTIRTVLSSPTRTLLADIRVFPALDSTNGYLLQLAERGEVDAVVCLAECQLAGRGRRGRHWTSPFAANLYLSLLWRFAPPPAALSGLSLAVGVATVRALESLGADGVRLKWPNDLLWRERKLAGVLLESCFLGRTAMVVIGIGLNVAMPGSAREGIDQPWVDLQEVMDGAAPSRNRLAAAILDQLVVVLPVMQHEGLAPLLADWQRLDGLRGRRVALQLPDGTQVAGVVAGIDEQGALRLDTGQGEQRFAVGEVGMRRMA